MIALITSLDFEKMRRGPSGSNARSGSEGPALWARISHRTGQNGMGIVYEHEGLGAPSAEAKGWRLHLHLPSLEGDDRDRQALGPFNLSGHLITPTIKAESVLLKEASPACPSYPPSGRPPYGERTDAPPGVLRRQMR